MSYSVNKTTITLTRGDTCKIKISITDDKGNSYTPADGDKIRFAMKRTYADPEPVVLIDVPVSTMLLVIEPNDTKDLAFGSYVYDIQLTKANGDVDTFITKAELKLTEEVY